MFLFPFDRVKRGWKIILYGFGAVGRDYYAQIQKLNYCTILFCVDQNFISLRESGIDIRSPKEIKSNLLYDAVVIALNDAFAAHTVACTLFSEGIPASKIITSPDSKCECIQCDAEELREILSDNNRFDKLMTSFSLIGLKNWFFFKPLELALRKANLKDIEAFVCAIEKKLDDFEAEMFYYILYQSRRVNAKIMKRVMERLLSLDAANVTVVDIGLRYFMFPMDFPDEIYDDFYLDWRKWMRRIAIDNGLSRPSKPERLGHEGTKKIAICTWRYQAKGIGDGYCYVVTRFANMFSSQGYEVKIFVSDILSQTEDESIKIDGYCLPSLSFRESNQKELSPCINVVYRNERTKKERLQNEIDDIFAYNPDIIFDMTDELFPQGYILKDAYPIVYAPIRGHATGAFFHKYLTNDMEKCLDYNKRFRSVEPEDIVVNNLEAVQEIAVSQNCYTRSELGFADTDFLIVTVGTRLRQEIGTELLDEMCDLLRRHESYKWLLVGDAPWLDESHRELLKSRKLICWGFEKRLMDLYGICDVYLNPRRMGGGVSIRLAMAAGLPIVMSDEFSDALYSVGQENCVHGSTHDMVLYLEKLHDNEKLRFDVAQRMKHRIQDGAIRESKQNIENILRQCIKDFKRETL